MGGGVGAAGVWGDAGVLRRMTFSIRHRSLLLILSSMLVVSAASRAPVAASRVPASRSDSAASCGVDTSTVSAFQLGVRMTLSRTDSVATRIRSRLLLPSGPLAMVTIVSDSSTCTRVRDAIVATHQQRPQDRRRPLLLARVDTMYVALDLANTDRTLASTTLVFTESMRFVGAFK